MEYSGTIVRIENTEIVSDKFKKRIFTVTDGATSYPNTVQFELHQDRTDIIDSFKIGDAVKVNFNLKGRDWKNPQGQVKTFNTLQCWAIIKDGHKVNNQNPEPDISNNTLVPTPDDDLPF